jgi:hypothetical protein
MGNPYKALLSAKSTKIDRRIQLIVSKSTHEPNIWGLVVPTVPDKMAADVEAVCTGACSLESCVVDHLEAMRARLEHYLKDQGLL